MIKIKNIILKLLGRKPIRVVIAETGYFNLSTEAWERLIELGCSVYYYDEHKEDRIIKGDPDIMKFTPNTRSLDSDDDRYFFRVDFPRNDERLLQVVEELGERANTDSCKLKIVTLPLDVRKFLVGECDLGDEYVCEPYRTFC